MISPIPDQIHPSPQPQKPSPPHLGPEAPFSLTARALCSRGGHQQLAERPPPDRAGGSIPRLLDPPQDQAAPCSLPFPSFPLFPYISLPHASPLSWFCCRSSPPPMASSPARTSHPQPPLVQEHELPRPAAKLPKSGDQASSPSSRAASSLPVLGALASSSALTQPPQPPAARLAGARHQQHSHGRPTSTALPAICSSGCYTYMNGRARDGSTVPRRPGPLHSRQVPRQRSHAKPLASFVENEHWVLCSLPVHVDRDHPSPGLQRPKPSVGAEPSPMGPWWPLHDSVRERACTKSKSGDQRVWTLSFTQVRAARKHKTLLLPWFIRCS